MFTSLTIQNMRGIKRVSVDGFKRVNLVLGRNNTTKTTLLEAVFLLGGGATSPIFPTLIGQLRGQQLGNGSPDALWRPLFFNMNPSLPVEIWGQWENEKTQRHLRIEGGMEINYADASIGEQGVIAATQDLIINKLTLRYTSGQGHKLETHAKYDSRNGRIVPNGKERDDFVRSTFLSAARSYATLDRNAKQLSYLLKNKHEQDVLEAMAIMESRIKRIEVLSENAGSSVYVDINLPSLIPLVACGEGSVRLFSMIVEITATRNGVLLIDEIDNGLHHSVMNPLWNQLGVLCKKHNVQVFATTHNEEMIFSALNSFRTCPNELGLFRIDRRNDEHSIASYDQEAQQAVLQEHFEVRG